MGNNNEDDAKIREASLLERRLNALKNVAPLEGGGVDRSNQASYRGKGMNSPLPEQRNPQQEQPKGYPIVFPDDSSQSYRGKAGCAVSHIYGANDRRGIRRGRLTIAETPARTTVRLTILGADQKTATVELDEEGFGALKEVISFGANRIDRPVSPTVTKEDTARELLVDLADVADPRAPIDSQQFLAAVAIGAVAASAAGVQPKSWTAIPGRNPTPLGEALAQAGELQPLGTAALGTAGSASPNGGRRAFNLDTLDEATETDGPTQAPREDMQF